MATNVMKEAPIVVERTFDATPTEVWQAITDGSKMKEWYFDIKDFKAEPGAEFQFYAGDGKKQYLHLWKITEVVTGKKISYSWKYDFDPGISHVTFELFPEGNKTEVEAHARGAG